MVNVNETFLGHFVTRSLRERDASIDTMRGFAIFGMILVNHAPPTPDVFSIFKHAPWIGWTFADMIFPMFLFLVGVSIGYSQRKSASLSLAQQQLRIARRTALLIVINVVLINFPYYELEKLVVFGTLSRIAVCYFFVALLGLYFGWRSQLLVLGGILLAQWYILEHYNVPGFGSGAFTIEGNASVYLDKAVFGDFAKRLFLNGPIIQGLLPGAGAIASTLLGSIAGRWITNFPRSMQVQCGLFGAGIGLFAAGLLLGPYYPISKPLWTGSYVIMMGGLSLMALPVFDWLLQVRSLAGACRILRIAGVNALFIYVFAQSLQRVLVYGRVSNEDGSTTRLRYFIYEDFVEPYIDGKAGSLLYAVVFLAICYAVVAYLYKRKIFFKL